MHKSFYASIVCLSLIVPITTPALSADLPPEERVFFGPCMGDDNEGAVLTAIASALISKGVSKLGSVIRSAGEERSTVVSARRNLDFAGDGNYACIQFVRGRFGDSPADYSEDFNLTAKSWREFHALQAMRGSGLRDDPEVLIELGLRRSQNEAAIALVPRLLAYGRTLDGSTRSERALGLDVRFHPPGVSANGDGSTGETVFFGVRRPGAAHDFDPPSDPKKDPWGRESAWFPWTFPGSDATATVPMILTATLTETRSARPFLLALADVFDGSADELKSKLELALLEEKRREADAAAAEASQTAEVEAAAKRAEAEIARIDYCAGGSASDDANRQNRLRLSADLLAKQVAANAAARAAGLNAPFGTLVTVSDDAPTGC